MCLDLETRKLLRIPKSKSPRKTRNRRLLKIPKSKTSPNPEIENFPNLVQPWLSLQSPFSVNVRWLNFVYRYSNPQPLKSIVFLISMLIRAFIHFTFPSLIKSCNWSWESMKIKNKCFNVF